MLQSEFHKLAGMEVSQEEYSHIEAVYMASSLNKQEFVYYWKKMNSHRITQYKEHMRAKHYYELILNKFKKDPSKTLHDSFSPNQLKYLKRLDLDEYYTLHHVKLIFETEGTCANHWAF